MSDHDPLPKAVSLALLLAPRTGSKGDLSATGDEVPRCELRLSCVDVERSTAGERVRHKVYGGHEPMAGVIAAVAHPSLPW